MLVVGGRCGNRRPNKERAQVLLLLATDNHRSLYPMYKHKYRHKYKYNTKQQVLFLLQSAIFVSFTLFYKHSVARLSWLIYFLIYSDCHCKYYYCTPRNSAANVCFYQVGCVFNFNLI